jgi:hypothetical protein
LQLHICSTRLKYSIIPDQYEPWETNGSKHYYLYLIRERTAGRRNKDGRFGSLAILPFSKMCSRMDHWSTTNQNRVAAMICERKTKTSESAIQNRNNPTQPVTLQVIELDRLFTSLHLPDLSSSDLFDKIHHESQGLSRTAASTHSEKLGRHDMTETWTMYHPMQRPRE